MAGRRWLNQKQLSETIGFKDRQTLSAIENGQRKVSSAELLAFIRALGKDLDYFTDPFRLSGRGLQLAGTGGPGGS